MTKKLLSASADIAFTQITLDIKKLNVNVQTQSPAVKRIQVEPEEVELDAVKRKSVLISKHSPLQMD